MNKFQDGEDADNFVIRRFFTETMYPPSIPSFVSTGTALLEHILISFYHMEERNE